MNQHAPDIDALTQCARSLLAEIGAVELAKTVQVRWHRRLSSTAGSADIRGALVNLNPRLADLGPEEIDRTLRHELAHLVARARAGRRRIAPHGAEWKQACIALGLNGERRCDADSARPSVPAQSGVPFLLPQIERRPFR